MKNKKQNQFLQIALGVFTILALVSAMTYWYRYTSTPGKLDEFAACLDQKGAKFYGAFWCPHCQEQKALFGKSKDKLPYIECSNPDQSQTAICKEKGITGYPTWIFEGAASSTGKKTLLELAKETGCVLPQ